MPGMGHRPMYVTYIPSYPLLRVCCPLSRLPAFEHIVPSLLSQSCNLVPSVMLTETTNHPNLTSLPSLIFCECSIGGPGARDSAPSTGPCFAFQRGECNRGDGCRFSHAGGAPRGGAGGGDRPGAFNGGGRAPVNNRYGGSAPPPAPTAGTYALLYWCTFVNYYVGLFSKSSL